MKKIIKLAVIYLLLLAGTCSLSYVAAADKKPAPKKAPFGLSYEYEGKKLHLHLKPYDKETEEIIKKHGVFTQITPVGDVVTALNPAALEEELMAVTLKHKIVMRSGYTKISNDKFAELVKEASEKKFELMKGADPEEVKFFLGRKDYARPIVEEGGQIKEDEFLLHNVILAYWK